MEQHEDTGSFAPDQHHQAQRTRQAHQDQSGTVGSARRRWRAPAAATSMAFVAAVCLYTGSAAHATAIPQAAGVSAVSVRGVDAKAALSANAVTAATASTGGVHGAFKAYDGPGGGIEFWFNPSTGNLTVAVGAGVGVGAAGVLGTYAPGSEPAAGTYLYASATLAAGTVVSENVAGSYSMNNGVFSGSISTTVEGRTLTLNSDGTTSFNVSVLVNPGAAGWTASTGVNFVFSFNVAEVLEYIWNAITDFFTGEYSLTNGADTGSGDATVYADDSSTDGTLISADGSSDGTSSDDSSDSSGDGGDGGDGGGGGGCSFSSDILPDEPSGTTVTHASTSTLTPEEDDEADNPVMC